MLNKIIPQYHGLLRTEILQEIPLTAKRIMDYGCGTGELGKALKARQKCKVVGIEFNEEAAKIACKNLDICHNNDLNIPTSRTYGEKYDCQIFADILEHLQDPWRRLTEETDKLKNNGTVIISLPNIAHHSIINDLARGVFRYEIAGIRDITHMRFFTLLSASEMIAKAGLKIKKVIGINEDITPKQYVFVCKKVKKKFPQALCTLIMPVCNNMHLTRQCIDSIFTTTLIPFNLIVVDNGSTDGTRELLREDERIIHVEGTHNLGFARATNIGMQFIETPYFGFVNNDLIFSKGWLLTLLETFNHDDKLGAVGPKTNNAAGAQKYSQGNYTTREQFLMFAENFKNSQKDPYFFVKMLVFFCTIFKTEIIKKVGMLDERFKIGNFEDNAYSQLIINAGYKMAVNNKCYIHHYGSQTFKALNINYEQTMNQGYAIFRQFYKA